jgi:hypothetical protein
MELGRPPAGALPALTPRYGPACQPHAAPPCRCHCATCRHCSATTPMHAVPLVADRHRSYATPSAIKATPPAPCPVFPPSFPHHRPPKQSRLLPPRFTGERWFCCTSNRVCPPKVAPHSCTALWLHVGAGDQRRRSESKVSPLPLPPFR